jgi:hypothetical protein
MSARRAFEKMKDVIIAYPFGDTKTVEIHTRKPGVITEKLVRETFAKNKELKFVSLEESVVEKAN